MVFISAPVMCFFAFSFSGRMAQRLIVQTLAVRVFYQTFVVIRCNCRYSKILRARNYSLVVCIAHLRSPLYNLLVFHLCTCHCAVIRIESSRAVRCESNRIESSRIGLFFALVFCVCGCAHAGPRLPTCDERKAWNTSSLAQVKGVAVAAG
jgi:hypothetical protein